ncbi:hypothetical protein AB0G00_24145 [Nocardia salmonicida]|uniref:hypothetical protein n=1 Tax=Nocardia salmonicida TaxID=53431 RepID=UPI0033EA7D2C
MKNMEQRIAEIQAEGNESAMFALLENPKMLAAVEAAYAAGARWSKYDDGDFFGLSEPGAMETLVIIHPSDNSADFGDSIQKYT